MTIRLVELINSFYRDEVDESDKKDKPMGKYCCFGYFDAMDVEIVRNIGNGRKDNWEILNEASVKRLNGMCNSTNVLCLTRDDSKDENFWEFAEGYPFLFVTMIRIAKESKKDSEYQKNFMDKINNEDDTIAYYSSSHCEVIVMKCSKGYKSGAVYVHGLRSTLNDLNMKIVKMYTIFSIREAELQRGEEIASGIEDQPVHCRMRGVVKEPHLLVSFINTLHNKLKLDGNESSGSIEVYKTLGGNDVLIEINDVQLSRLLSCYRAGELLTHSNKLYGNTFYNVETEILDKECRVEWSNGS